MDVTATVALFMHCKQLKHIYFSKSDKQKSADRCNRSDNTLQTILYFNLTFNAMTEQLCVDSLHGGVIVEEKSYVSVSQTMLEP